MYILLNSLATVINLIFQIYFYIVIGRAIISWVNPDPYNPIVRFLHSATEPVLYRIRKLLPVHFGGIDLSPIILLVGLEVVRQVLISLIATAMRGMGGY